MMISYLEEHHLEQIVEILMELDCATSKHYGLPVRSATHPVAPCQTQSEPNAPEHAASRSIQCCDGCDAAFAPTRLG
jgi:hypothetical protein